MFFLLSATAICAVVVLTRFLMISSPPWASRTIAPKTIEAASAREGDQHLAPSNPGAARPSAGLLGVPRLTEVSARDRIGAASVARAPQLGPPGRRPDESDVAHRMRGAFLDAFRSFVVDAKLSDDDQAKVRALYYDAQLNYAVLRMMFEKWETVEDAQNHRPVHRKVSAIDRAGAGVDQILKEGFARTLTPEQQQALQKGEYYMLREGNSMMYRPFDVDELSEAGIAKDTGETEIRQIVVEDVRKQIPGDGPEQERLRQLILRKIGL
jgi:hypothetical protein